MKWFVRGVSLVMLFVAGVYGYGALVLPDEKRVERSIRIAASPAAVFAVANDMRVFNDWSPWYGLDPATVYRFDGPATGPGAAMRWTSDDPQVGTGSQVIVASEPNRLVRTRLQFGASRTAMSELLIEPAARGTQVTWALETEFDGSILQRYVGAFVLEGAVGSDYERGLERLKALIETGSRAPGRGTAAGTTARRSY
jgi:uncharacterized protein YndB with AHSA1/START domain